MKLMFALALTTLTSQLSVVAAQSVDSQRVGALAGCWAVKVDAFQGSRIERRHCRHVDRLLLYWTSDPRKQDALMVLPYDPNRVEEAGLHFDETVCLIQARGFVATPPEAAICKECDLRMLCHAEGVISQEARG